VEEPPVAHPGPVGSTIHDDFREVADRFPRLVRGARGASVAVYHRDELVLDTWTGRRDAATGDPWQRDTVAMAWSTTKGVTSAAAHIVAQQGAFALDDPVAAHWPEFAVEGKRATTVRQLLAQEAGLFDIRHLVPDARAMLDHDRMAAALAGAAPAHAPGAANGYHALTYGYLVDELIRRTTGRTLAEVGRTEIAEPLQLDGFTIGSVGVDPDRIAPPPTFADASATLQRGAKLANLITRIPPVRVDLRTVAGAFVPRGGAVIGSPVLLATGNGSIGGLFTARSLARFYAALVADDGLDGTTIWSPATRAAATVQQGCRRDRVLSVRPLWSVGFHRPWPRSVLGADAFGFFGMYGSGAWGDRGRRLAVALVTPDATGLPLAKLGKELVAITDRR
jgi:CubicO group peptidase (beta-lactamase class C family)